MNQIYNNCKKNTLFKYICREYLPNHKIDHIAYRSFNKNIIINNLENNGFKKQCDNFNFENHNAHAVWLKNTESIIPRVFLSEYNNIYTDSNLLNSNIDIDKINYYINNEDVNIPYNLYIDIYNVNQYLAWTLVYRHYVVNHIAFEVENIELLYNKLNNDKIINMSNNLQISEDKNLIQFSTKAEDNLVKFTEGYFNIPVFFIEFVERKNNRDGFSEKNANIIFDSTSSKKTEML